MSVYFYMRETTFFAVGLMVSCISVAFLRLRYEMDTYTTGCALSVARYHLRSWAAYFCILFIWMGLCLAFFPHIRPFGLVGFFFCILVGDYGLKRLSVTILTHTNTRRINTRNMFIVGLNKRSLAFNKLISENKALGFNVIGFIDETKKYDELENADKERVSYLGGFDGIEEVLRHRAIDAIAVFLPLRSFYDRNLDIIQMAQKYGVSVDFMILPFEPEKVKIRFSHVGNFNNILYYSGPRESLALGIKRVMDIVGALVFFLIFWPLLLGIALFIKITDGGPVLFEQNRMGYNKRVFSVLKFRTMVRDAEARLAEVKRLNEMDGAVFKISNDPRIIKGGAFLRRYSLDELPQFWNVLRGRMSLVGPRPLPVREYEFFPEDWQLRRLSMKPGLTCIWQVSGRNNIGFNDWMKMDLQYIDNWSLGLDVMLLLKTVREVFRGGGK